MVYFDQSDPVVLDVDVSTNVFYITNHGPDSSYPALKFSARRWFDKNGILNPGKGITLQPEESWDLVLGLIQAAQRAKIPMPAETRTRLLTTLAQQK